LNSIVHALIVDDEPLARRRIKVLLQQIERVAVIGECADGRQAVDSILNLRPDLVFLDIQMPELDGFEVIDAIGTDRMPVVVFVTAFDRYAVKAFDVHAVDYLLKPFDRLRFSNAVERALHEIDLHQQAGMSQNVRALISSLRADEYFESRILVKLGGRISILNANQIDWIEAAGNYVQLHAGKEVYLLRETMKSMEQRLPPGIFVRIHRSFIVNVECIKELQPHFHGDHMVILKDKTRLTLSRRYRDRLGHVIGGL